jgi:hypothetical protein
LISQVQKTNKTRRFFKQLVFFLVSLICILVGTEIYLRYSLPGWHTARMSQQVIEQHTRIGFRYDRDLMWYWQKLPSPDQMVNEFGFRRKKEMSKQKSPTTKRVIIFGDSQTYGGGAEYNQTFSFFAEEYLGENWEVLNAGISGYRTLNIFRLMRQKMLAFEPDIFIVNSMLYDSPAENGQLHNEIQAENKQLWLREWLWNSRLNYVFQLSLRNVGIAKWEDLPWPIHLHNLLDDELRPQSKDFGNHKQIAKWSKQRGIQTIFMEYAINDTRTRSFGCQATEQSLPKPVFLTCQILQKSDYPPEDIFIDNNHFTPTGAAFVGKSLGEYLQQNF